MSQSWWEKVGNLARSLQATLTIWREILTFKIKKYIRSSGKSARKNTFIQAVITVAKPYPNIGTINTKFEVRTSTFVLTRH